MAQAHFHVISVEVKQPDGTALAAHHRQRTRRCVLVDEQQGLSAWATHPPVHRLHHTPVRASSQVPYHFSHTPFLKIYTTPSDKINVPIHAGATAEDI